MDRFSPNQVPTYHVEHLATFSTTSAQHEHVTPRMALQRLFKMEKTSGIWTQRMAIQLKGNHMWILDGETNDVVERFPVAFIQQPTSFNDQNHIYNNILIFTVQLPNESQGELHIFQCVSHDAVNVVDDIYHWMRHYGVSTTGVTSSSSSSSQRTGSPNHHHHNNNNGLEKTNNNNNGNHRDPVGGGMAGGAGAASSPSSNVNVKEAVNAFNQIAAQRENSFVEQHPPTSQQQPPPSQSHPSPSTAHHHHNNSTANNTNNNSSSSSVSANNNSHHHHSHNPNSSSSSSHHRNHEMHETYSNERYVSILNHCFDDIERFIIRLQHAAAALRELQIRSHKRGAKGSGDGILAIRARGPCEEEFFEILSKFKLAFNLLAKLKGCIHDPNAPELVHFLFTPLVIIIEAARGNDQPVDPSLVGIPYLSPDAIELLSNCCTSKEYDLWQSLGANWVQPVKHIRMTSPFQPVFTDGWAPAITEPELLGIIALQTELESDPDELLPPGAAGGPPARVASNQNSNSKSRITHSHTTFDDSDYDDHHHNGENPRIIAHHSSSNPISRTTPTTSNNQRLASNTSPSPIESIDRDSPTTTNGIDAEQMDWLAELQSRNAKIIRVLFPRTANNNKELTVTRGEILEVLDDSRKWWKARNSRGQVAHVPHTIVEVESSHLMMASSSIAGGNSNNGSAHHHPSTSMMMTQDDWIRRERQDVDKIQTNDDNVDNNNNNLGKEMKDNEKVQSEPVESKEVIVDVHITNGSKQEVAEKQRNRRETKESSPTLSFKSLFSFSTYDTLEQELHDRFSQGDGTYSKAKTKAINQSRQNDDFLRRYSEKSEDQITSKDLEEFLVFKEFPPDVIEFVETLFKIKEIKLNLLYWSKEELRKNIPFHIANDFLIQRLYSNLLLLKNVVKPSKMNTLAFKLKQRKKALIENLEKSKEQENVKENGEEMKENPNLESENVSDVLPEVMEKSNDDDNKE